MDTANHMGFLDPAPLPSLPLSVFRAQTLTQISIHSLSVSASKERGERKGREGQEGTERIRLSWLAGFCLPWVYFPSCTFAMESRGSLRQTGPFSTKLWEQVRRIDKGSGERDTAAQMRLNLLKICLKVSLAPEVASGGDLLLTPSHHLTPPFSEQDIHFTVNKHWVWVYGNIVTLPLSFLTQLINKSIWLQNYMHQYVKA